jgi:SAM-dependent methyltransferase
MTETNAKDYWESLHSKSYGLTSVGYIGVGRPFNTWMYRVRRRVFRNTVRAFIPGHDPEILDVGSGTGFYLDRWWELGFRRISGSDVSEMAVERLRNQYPSLDIADLDIGEESAGLIQRQFDVVSIMDVLFHITSDRSYEQAFANLAALVRPGGILVLSENFVHQASPREAQQVNRSLAGITSLLEAVGFEPLARRPMFILMNYPVDSTSRLHKLCWRTLVLAMAAWNPLGVVVGAVLYPLEILLVGRLKEGPSTELMVCRRLPDERVAPDNGPW